MYNYKVYYVILYILYYTWQNRHTHVSRVGVVLFVTEAQGIYGRPPDFSVRVYIHIFYIYIYIFFYDTNTHSQI